MCLKPGLRTVRPLSHPYVRKSPTESTSGPDRVRKNSEKRKEKSRDAARCRRSKESEIFTELASTLPLPTSAVAQLDKASIMRLCIAFLRTRDLIHRGLRIFTGDANTKGQIAPAVFTEISASADSLLMTALDGFLLVLTREGDIVYSSDSISTFLGISQMDTMGQSVMEYAHPCDHEELRCLVSPKGSTVRHAFIRMKCTISSKGRNVNLKSASYKVVQMCGRNVQLENPDGTKEEDEGGSPERDSWVVAVGVPVPHPSNIDIPLDTQTFVSKHSLDMKFTYVDESIEKFCNYNGHDLLGKSMYDIPHAMDSSKLRASFKTLLVKGQVETERYRFLAGGGGYVWTVTQATLISGSKDNKPQYVVCLNYVVSEIIQPTLVLSEIQLRGKQARTQTEIVDRKEPITLAREPEAEKTKNFEKPSGPPTRCQPMPVAATSTLLREKPKDLDVGFLTFSNNDPNATVLKEEPEDLTHLAPSGGDSCLPLDIPHLLNQELDDLFQFEPVSSFNHVVDLLRFENSPIHSPNAGSNKDLPLSCPVPATQNCLKYPRKDLVPEQISSPYSSTASPNIRFDTPEPPSPRSPLLSQAADISPKQVSPMIGSYPGPKSSTEQLLLSSSDQNVQSPSSSTMDLFSGFNTKLEDPIFDNDDFDARAPFVSPMDMLILGPDNLFMTTNIHDQQTTIPQLESENSLDDVDLSDIDRLGNSQHLKKNSPLLRSNSPLQSSKNIGCVNPNQVLAVQFSVQDGSAKSSGELRQLLQEPVPPLRQKTSSVSPPPFERSLKRAMSPPATPVLKRVRSTFSNNCESRPIFAPVMQQLLVSKESGDVPERLMSGLNMCKPPADATSTDERSHSVLRNLLTSGRDDIAGYTVYVSGLSDAQGNTSTDQNKAKPDNSGDLPVSLEALASLPVNRDGKVELTKQQLSTLLGSAGLRYMGLNESPKQKKTSSEQYVVLSSDSGLQDFSSLDYHALQDPDFLTVLDRTL